MRPSITLCIQAAALTGLAVLCAILANAFAGGPRHLAWLEVNPVPSTSSGAASAAASTASASGQDAPPILQRFVSDPSQPIRDLHADEAWALYQAKISFLDARRTDEYTAGHIAGAWLVPVWESDMDARMTKFEATAHPSSKDPLVLYCNGGDCEDSRILANKLVGLGYRNLLIYREGYPDWLKQNHPISKGDQP
jgi:rhodanese-related sulfurtransferase